MRVVWPPSSVTRPPPSIVVALPLGSLSSDVRAIVVGPPQSKVMTPPVATAARSAASVHWWVPAPTTVVGALGSAAARRTWHARDGGTGGASGSAAASVEPSARGLASAVPDAASDVVGAE